MLARALQDIQSRFGYLPPAELEFLAIRTKVPLYRIQEISTFFPHFRKEKPPEVTVHICTSMTCHLREAPKILAETENNFKDQGKVEIKGVSCLGRCDRAPVAQISLPPDKKHKHDLLFVNLGTKGRNLTEIVTSLLNGKDPHPDHDFGHPADRPTWEIDIYDPRSGTTLEPYSAVKQFLNGKLDAEKVIKSLGVADLVGMGGGAARTSRKWQEVMNARGKKRFIICNGDESEPGTFKDREILLHAPHLIIEGMLIAGLTLGAKTRETIGYIYIRHEYGEQIESVNKALEEAQKQVPEAFKVCPIEVFVSPGRYICGEESALIEAIEGNRAQPRIQPPSIKDNGLFNQPTLVNNVETYAWVPALLLPSHSDPQKAKPLDWYVKEPRRFFSISGDIKKPGVFEVPFHCTLGQLIDHAGGMSDKLNFFAVAPSGPTGGFLPSVLPTQELCQKLDNKETGIPNLINRSKLQGARVEAFRKTITKEQLSVRELPLDVALFRTAQLSLGAGIIVYGTQSEAASHSPDMLEHVLNCLKFYEKESCGKCVPCRLGCQQLVHFAEEMGANKKTSLPMVKTKDNGEGLAKSKEAVQKITEAMEATSICGLGRAASTPLNSWLEYFCK